MQSNIHQLSLISSHHSGIKHLNLFQAQVHAEAAATVLAALGCSPAQLEAGSAA